MLDKAYAWLELHMAGREWAAGDDFSLADCAAGPFLFYADWSHPLDGRFPKVAAYRQRLMARPAFQRCIEEARPYRAFFPGGARLEMYADIENFGNLLNDEWGVIQQVGFPYLSNNVVAANCQVQTCAAGAGDFYEYQQLRTNSAASFNNQSVWQVKVGVRYRF